MIAQVVLCLVLADPLSPQAPTHVRQDGASSRAFLALEGAAGAGLRGRLTGGLGDPVKRWFGVDLEAVTFSEFGRLAASLRAVMPGLDVSLGGAWTRSYRRPFLVGADELASLDGEGERARYFALELNATGYAPLPIGYAMLWLEAHRPLTDIDGRLLYDESLRAIVGSGIAVATRTSWLIPVFGSTWVAGPLGEHLWLGDRDRSLWRVGGLVSHQFSRRWQFSAALTIPVGGPDDLELRDSLWGTAWFSYRWTSR